MWIYSYLSWCLLLLFEFCSKSFYRHCPQNESTYLIFTHHKGHSGISEQVKTRGWKKLARKSSTSTKNCYLGTHWPKGQVYICKHKKCAYISLSKNEFSFWSIDCWFKLYCWFSIPIFLFMCKAGSDNSKCNGFLRKTSQV